MKWKVALLLLLAVPAARAEPWLCTDANGNQAFNYEPESAHKKNCVDHPIPDGNVWRATPSVGAQDFPRVDARSQKHRDAERRRLLERELAAERESLATAVKALAELKQTPVTSAKSPVHVELKIYEERIRVHQTNIANLQKELAGAG